MSITNLQLSRNKTETDLLRLRPNYDDAKHVDPDRTCDEHLYFLANYTVSGIGRWVCPMPTCEYSEPARRPRAAKVPFRSKSLTDVNISFVAIRPDGQTMNGQIHWETFTKLVKSGEIEIREVID